MLITRSLLFKNCILAFYLLFLFSLSSCSFTPTEYDSLDKTLKSYERAIRWRNYDFARAFHIKPADVSDYKRQSLQGIRVTSYRIIEQVIAPDYSKADIIVDIRYIQDSSATERVLTNRQKWIYDAQAERWQLETPFPDFKFR